MSYLVQDQIAGNPYMLARVAQCATGETIADADTWTSERRREWAAAPGWDAAWESALVAHADEEDYNPGKDEACITDAMILSQVQQMQSEPRT